MSDLQSLDLSRLLLVHTGLAMGASIFGSPVWNLPISLYGLIVVNKAEGSGGGDSVREFAAILAGSFILDLFWFMSHDGHVAWLGMLLILMNFVLKPVTLLASLGNLRQRGEPTFNIPTGFSIPGSFPPRPSETVWQAPPYQAGSGGFPEDEEEEIAVSRPPPPKPKASQQQSAPSRPVAGAEGGGYHQIE
ncbi:hypothetical protein MNV49_006683 [Pseudohyphozyma bogoriensis]|nr:hypothetical protein MNV49_006683 [Pseudohyphozyma bogoriensis]